MQSWHATHNCALSQQNRCQLLRPRCGCRKWKLISHADTVNPFLASLVNHESRIKLTPILLGNHTLIEWQGATALLQAHAVAVCPAVLAAVHTALEAMSAASLVRVWTRCMKRV